MRKENFVARQKIIINWLLSDTITVQLGACARVGTHPKNLMVKATKITQEIKWERKKKNTTAHTITAKGLNVCGVVWYVYIYVFGGIALVKLENINLF